MNISRKQLIFNSIILIVLSGFGFSIWFPDTCKGMIKGCPFLLLLIGLSALGSIMLYEWYINSRKTNGESKSSTDSNNGKSLPFSFFVTRSIARLILAGILLSAPIIIQGAYVATFLGLMFGLGIDGLFRGLVKKLP